MKNKLLLALAAVTVFGFTSCKDEKQEQAQKTVDQYTTYVDSVSNVASADVKDNWEAVSARSEQQLADAKAALANLKDRTAAEEKLNTAEAKYASWKTNVETELAAAAKPDPKMVLRNSLFGEGKVGTDMNFDWVNKDNIHSVYQQFVHTAEDNKDKYTREDWDEIKLMWEALDSRKNTVEKEGLSSSDNMKIAGLKVKFAPMLLVNRIGAKAEETEEAKK